MNYNKIDIYKLAIDKMRPFEGEILRELQDYYRIGLTWSSNAIEGNTLTISETKVILEDGLTIGGKPLRELYEVVGHGDAYDFMFTLMHKKHISTDDIKTMHSLFYKTIDADNAGVWRRRQIIVTGSDYVFPKPNTLDEQMQALDEWIKTNRDKHHPVEFASLLHLKFVSIHPFIDGNGRVSRLLMNLALIQRGYIPVVIPPICRPEYLDAIRWYQRIGDNIPFAELVADRMVESQKELMRLFHIDIPKLDQGFELRM